MSRTTSRRRAAGIGFGALAAVALVASPVSAVTAPAPEEADFVLDATDPEDIFVSVYGGAADEDQANVLQSVPVPESGRVDFLLPAPVAAGADVAVDLFDSADYEDADVIVPLEVEVAVVPVVDADGVTTLQLTIPLDSAGLRDEESGVLAVEDVEVSITGLEVEGLEGAEIDAYTLLDLQPSRLGELLILDPAPVEGSAGIGLGLDPVSFTAGDSLSLSFPEGSALEAFGIESLDYVDAYLYPYDAGFEWTSSVAAVGSMSSGALAAAPESLAAAVATGQADEALQQAAAAAVEVDALDELDEEDLYLVAEIEEGGRSATLTSSADLPTGEYEVSLTIASADFDTSINAFSTADVTAAAVEEPTPVPTAPAPAPVPTPTVTVVQPAPTATVTRAPVRQNPGLRSNTGVETATVPGLSAGQLVGLGAGLLVLGSAGGAVALRSQRRARA